MKRCPTCGKGLRREVYEREAIFRCPGCRGVLVAGYHLDLIKHRKVRTTEALKTEAHEEFHGNTEKAVTCPRCLTPMAKRPFASRYARLSTDTCPKCRFVWLDGGELALLQLVFEASAQARDTADFQQRMRTMLSSPARHERFEADLARLPKDLPEVSGDATDRLVLELVGALLGPWNPKLH